MQLTPISGGVCAAQGFQASGVHCGIRKNREKRDLALIVSEVPCAVGCTYTQNKVFGAPITVTREHVADGMAQAMICNSGNANTCNANGVEIANQTCALIADALFLKPSDIIIASTGVIGQPLDITPIANGIPALVDALSADGSDAACEGIMTTDTVPKQAAYAFPLGGKTCHIGGIAKGSGMIHPNMATMLCFITTDAAIAPALLQKAVSAVVEDTFNMVSVDGDTSTNDMLSVMANGLCGNARMETENADYAAFTQALFAVARDLSIAMAADGEGATKLLQCTVCGAPCKDTAKKVAKSVITSTLFKAAMFGEDANWGRILCAIGYTDAPFDIHRIAVTLKSEKGAVQVCENGAGVPFSEEEAARVLSAKQIDIEIDMHSGDASATAWGCDLTYDYVKINGDYRT